MEAALKDGYHLSVNNGGDENEIEHSCNKEAILATMFQTDDEILILNKLPGRRSWVRLVYGNEGWTVLADYTVDLESLIRTLDPMVDKFCDECEASLK